MRDGHLVGVDDGVSRRSTAVFHVHSATFRSLVSGESSASHAVASGRVRIEGNGMDRRRLEDVLQAAATSDFVEVRGELMRLPRGPPRPAPARPRGTGSGRPASGDRGRKRRE